MILHQFFAQKGKYAPYMMFSIRHFFLAILCAVLIGISVSYTRFSSLEGQKQRIKICTFILWGLEISKNLFYMVMGNRKELLDSLPLYYCSLMMYCGLFSAYAKGWLKQMGDVFVEIGGLVGGVGYLISPCSTAGIYPAFHFITLNSFAFHAIMVYMSAIMIKIQYCFLRMHDIVPYAAVVIAMSILSFILNQILHTNFMFISQNFPGTPMEIVYKWSGVLFPVVITFFQAIPPFYLVYFMQKHWDKRPIGYHEKICPEKK